MTRQSIHDAARKDQALLDGPREQLGLAVLRRCRRVRIEAAGPPASSNWNLSGRQATG